MKKFQIKFLRFKELPFDVVTNWFQYWFNWISKHIQMDIKEISTKNTEMPFIIGYSNCELCWRLLKFHCILFFLLPSKILLITILKHNDFFLEKKKRNCDYTLPQWKVNEKTWYQRRNYRKHFNDFPFFLLLVGKWI